MFDTLTERQVQLLQAIINEYITNAEPVGSVELVGRYNLKCSAATVRNEMAKLIELGFLEMLHTSSGRVPTRSAYRLYLKQMVEEEELPVLQEVAMKQRLWSSRYEFGKLLHEASLALAESTNLLTFITTEDGFVTTAGASHILENKEFWDIEVAKHALKLMDDTESLKQLLQSAEDGMEIRTLIEDEIGIEPLKDCAIIFTDYKSSHKHGEIGVLGPSRMKYSNIMPALRYTRQLIQELGGSW
jgi:transcriptional regulator of heat shock response